MATPRRNAAATVVHNLLYIVGGDDGIMNLSSIEVFDPFYETWKYAKGRLTQGRSYAGVAVVDKPAETVAPWKREREYKEDGQTNRENRTLLL